MNFYKTVLTAITLVILLCGFISVDKSQSNNFFQKPSNGHVTKAIMFENEVIPVIDLPTITIEADRNTAHFQKAIMVNGNVYPLVTLDEIEIRPNY